MSIDTQDDRRADHDAPRAGGEPSARRDIDGRPDHVPGSERGSRPDGPEVWLGEATSWRSRLAGRIGTVELVAATVLLGVAVASVLVFGADPPPAAPVELANPPSALPSARVTEAPETITVHVAGRVARPGLVSVSAHGRVADAIAAAGGALERADLTSLNLAAPLEDGQQLVVMATDTPQGMAAPVRNRTLDLNTADASALEELPGVGPVLAERIVEHRDAFGPFDQLEDLLDVPGIGETKLAALRRALEGG